MAQAKGFLAVIRRLHKDESAQVSFLALAASLVLVGLMAMIINTSDVVRHRIHNQEVADVTALAAATWSARGLNTIAMLNVLNAKLLSMTVIVNAANRTMPVTRKILALSTAAATACTPFCTPWLFLLKGQAILLEPLAAGLQAMEQSVTRNCSGVAWKVMKGLQKASDAVGQTFGRIGYLEAPAIAARNGASSAFAVDGSMLEGSLTEVGKLPVSTTDRTPADFCAAMKSGGPGFVMQGYTDGEGPAEHGRGIWSDLDPISVLNPAFATLGSPWIFDGFYSSEMTRLGCDGSTPDKEGQKVEFSTLPQCREHDVTATWALYEDETDWLVDGSLDEYDFIAWVPRDVDLEGGGDAIETAAAAAGVDVSDVPAVTHTPTGVGARELIRQQRKRTRPASCAGRGRTGYPIVEHTVAGDLFFFSLRDHPEFTHFEVGETGFHQGASTDRSEATGTYFLRVNKTEREVALEGGSTRTEYKYRLDSWVLVDAGEKTLEGDELKEYYEEQAEREGVTDDGPVSSGEGCGTFPVPHLLVEEPEDKLRFFAVVNHGLGESGQPPKPFWSNYFSVSPTTFTSFSQAQVYNDLSTDMFTQDWRVRLERVTLLERALERAGELGLGSIASTASSVITTVNNH